MSASDDGPKEDPLEAVYEARIEEDWVASAKTVPKEEAKESTLERVVRQAEEGFREKLDRQAAAYRKWIDTAPRVWHPPSTAEEEQGSGSGDGNRVGSESEGSAPSVLEPIDGVRVKQLRTDKDGNEIAALELSFSERWEAGTVPLQPQLSELDNSSDAEEEELDAEGRRQGPVDDVQNGKTPSSEEEHPLPIPPLSLCLMVVGTRGDVEPFCIMGEEFKKHGHRVRIATHKDFEEMVKEEFELEFYPLAGDPRQLSEWMVRNGGTPVPSSLDEIVEGMEMKDKVLGEIIHSTWPAATEPDPGDMEEKPFLADAILANPPSYGGPHVGEALGIPVHMVFPQPWIPTTCYPHPMSNMDMSAGPSLRNYVSYMAIDQVLWMGISKIINHWRRKTLNLKALHNGAQAASIYSLFPFTFTWSPALCPKFHDWGPQATVVGALCRPVEDHDPEDELREFLEAGDPPIFIGFGSIVLKNTKDLTKKICDAARKRSEVRVIIQSSWSDMETDDLPDNVLQIGNCPHEWLFNRCAAVIHHGGAGTTNAGLRAGCPTQICPFFGDQHFWAQIVYERGVGLEPLPPTELTPDILAERFDKLLEPEIRKRAEKLGSIMCKENGPLNACAAFYRALRAQGFIERMVCDIFPDRVARLQDKDTKLKLSVEAALVIHGDEWENKTKPYRVKDWRMEHQPRTIPLGIIAGVEELTYEVGSALKDVVRMPVKDIKATRNSEKSPGAKRYIKSFARGTGNGLLSLVTRPLDGTVALLDDLMAGAVRQFHVKPTKVQITSVLPRWHDGRHMGGKQLNAEQAVENLSEEERQTVLEMYKRRKAVAESDVSEEERNKPVPARN